MDVEREISRLDGRIERMKDVLRKMAELLKELDSRVARIEKR